MPTYAPWSPFAAADTAMLTRTTRPSVYDRGHARHYRPSRQGQKSLRAIALALTGAAPGGMATATHVRVQGDETTLGNGGVRPFETVSVINRATTANDEIYLDLLFNPKFVPATALRDLSGNGSNQVPKLG